MENSNLSHNTACLSRDAVLTNAELYRRGGGAIQIFTNLDSQSNIGCRWWHMSNSNLGVHNPEFNGVQVSLGYPGSNRAVLNYIGHHG